MNDNNRLAQKELMGLKPIWITGATQSGKTTRLVSEFQRWVEGKTYLQKSASPRSQSLQPLASAILVFAANDDNRRELADKLSLSVQSPYPVTCKTPLGFISEEVNLFFPLLLAQLKLKAQFPLRLRPETEQELATRLWRSALQQGKLSQLSPENYNLRGVRESRFVRQVLDLLQLAGASGIEAEQIPNILALGGETLEFSEHNWQEIGELILEWRQWCLERGLLTYGIIYELYWRYLLPNPKYQHHLQQRYQAIFADDVDDYPAITRDLLEFLLDNNAFGIFTYNPDGQVRLGLNADPNYLLGLASRCNREEVYYPQGIGAELEENFLEFIDDPLPIISLPNNIKSIQTASRAELLRQTAEFIIKAVKRGEIQPEEIAIIAPGLDEIARYTLREILISAGIPIEPLNEQRSLISCPLIRALLTLLCLIYPGLGRLAMRDDIAEMLVVLSQKTKDANEYKARKSIPAIDPIRAGLIADYCYHIDTELPCLLPVETFPRWDRLGYRGTESYKNILEWIEKAKQIQKQQGFSNPIFILDLAIKNFISNHNQLSYYHLSALREFMETAQHFWEVEGRLQHHETLPQSQTATLIQFIQLLRRGTITANPRPLRLLGNQPGKITLATIFQYRSLRSFHPWQFWLDSASNLWEKGGASTLFAAPLFLRERSGRPWTSEDDFEADKARLKRILKDLLGRVGEKVFLCHSDLSVTGTEQTGPLLNLIHGSQEVALELYLH